MGLVTGSHDAKAEEFTFCGASLHNCMAGHGPDTVTFETASNAKPKPEKTDDTLAFMFETHWLVRPIAFAKETPMRKRDYQYCWAGLEDRFYASGKQS